VKLSAPNRYSYGRQYFPLQYSGPEVREHQAEMPSIFVKMVDWAVDERTDLIGQTFYYTGETLTVLEAAKENGLLVVITFAPIQLYGCPIVGRRPTDV